MPGLYLGSMRDMNDVEQIKDNKITHIISIHDFKNKVFHKVFKHSNKPN